MDPLNRRLQTLEALSDLTKKLAEASSSEAIGDAVLDALESALGAKRASVLLFDARGVMRFISWRGLSAWYRDAVDGHSPWKPDEQNARPILVADATTDPAMQDLLPVFYKEGIRSLAFIPVAVRGRLLGKFMLYGAEANEISQADVDAAQEFADRVAVGIDRVRADIELRESREQLAGILGAITDGVTVQDERGRVVFANAAAARIIGTDVETLLHSMPSDIVGRFEVFGADGAQLPTDALPRRQAVKGVTPPPRLIKFRMRETGEVRWSVVSAAPLKSVSGDSVLSVNVFRDVTVEHEAEERERLLSRAGELLAGSLEVETTLASVANLAVPVMADWCRVDVADEHGEPRLIAVAHTDPEKVKWAYEFDRRFHQPRERSAIARVMQNGQAELYDVVTDEMLKAATDDPEFLAILRQLGFSSVMLVPLTARGRTLGVISFIAAESRKRYDSAALRFATDLARRAALALDNAMLYRDEMQARAREEAASRAKDEFLATLSHELRTPLTSIVGWSGMLRETHVDEPTLRTALDSIARAAAVQSHIIDDLLEVSAITTGKVRLQTVPLHLSEVVSSAVDGIRPSATTKGLAVQYSAATDAVVLGDGHRLQQIFWNLLSNALKFTPRGGSIAVSVTDEGGEAVVRVSDTGIGINSELLPRVFDRFRQGDSSTTRAYGGLGLGLSIVKYLAELHGGSVAAESAGETLGSTFVVRLPVHASAAAGEDERVRLFDGLASRKVLVVDDDAPTLSFIGTLLERAGAETRRASSAAEAMSMIDAWPVDVIVSDISMPDTDGYSMIRKIRAKSAVPAIALTAYGGITDRERALSAGFTSYLRKPIEPSALLTEIRHLLRTSANAARTASESREPRPDRSRRPPAE